MKNVYLFQITPADESMPRADAPKWAFLPYTVAMLWEYANKFDEIKNNYQLSDYIFFRDSVDKIVDRVIDPDVIGISCYVWNTEIQLKIVKKVKERYPNCLIIAGGPHIPENRPKWFTQRKYIDLGVYSAGEEIFKNILIERLNGGNYEDIKGVIVNNGSVTKTESAPRIQDLNTIPSPYLNGSFDQIVESYPTTEFHAIYETNRGCPFACTFCDWGGLIHQKMKKFDLQRTKDEIEWMSKNKIFALWIADSNFGIFKDRDMEISDFIMDQYENSGYPEFYAVCGFSKTPAEKNSVREIQTRMRETLGYEKMPSPRVAIQTFNEVSLNNIKRQNLNIANIEAVHDNFQQSDIAHEVELLLPLPGMTYDNWADDLAFLVEKNADKKNYVHFMIYPVMILPNSEMGSDEYLNKHAINVTTMAFNSDVDNIEYADIVTSLKGMSEEDCKDCWMLYWIVSVFWISQYLKDLFDDLNKKYNISYKEIIIGLHQHVKHGNGVLTDRYNAQANDFKSSYYFFDIKQRSKADIKFIEDPARENDGIETDIGLFISTLIDDYDYILDHTDILRGRRRYKKLNPKKNKKILKNIGPAGRVVSFTEEGVEIKKGHGMGTGGKQDKLFPAMTSVKVAS